MGIENNDPITASYTTTATISSPVGTYPIVPAAAGSAALLANYVISLVDGTLTVTPVASIQPTILVLDRTASAALSITGNASIKISGAVQVNSNARNALQASGNAQVTAAAIGVVGKYQKSGNASLHPTPTTGVAVVPDPLAGLPIPGSSGTAQNIVFAGGSHALKPGLYSKIQLSGTAQVALAPGIYVIGGGGLSATGQARLSGNGVTIYLASGAGSGCSAGGGFTLSGGESVDISAPATGSYVGVAIYQARNNSSGDTESGNGTLDLQGAVFYAAAAELAISGGATVNASLVVDRLMMVGNARDVTTRAPSAAVAAGAAASTPAVCPPRPLPLRQPPR